MKHTPGPWGVRKETDPHQYIKTPFYIYAGDYLVATGGLQAEETMDNARLIASAPVLDAKNAKLKEINTELLEALEKIADYTISPWIVKDTAQRAIIKATS